MVNILLRNARIEGEPKLLDVAVGGGLIVDRGPSLDYACQQEFDLAGRLLIPGFVEGHLHLDIVLMNSWEHPGRVSTFRSQAGENQKMASRRRAFTREDIEERAGMALRLASRHGITALRAQCHVDTEVGLKHLEALLSTKESHSDIVTVQVVAFPQQGYLTNPGTLELIREAFRMGADIVGGSGVRDREGDSMIGAKRHYDTALNLAAELDVDLDVHIDHSIPVPARPFENEELEITHLARGVIEEGYQGRVTAGHLNALGSAPTEVAREAIALIREADINVVSLPDLYRLARQDTIHVRRGLTRVKELLGAGVNVSFASNNVRDAIRPMGNLNLLEEALVLSYGAHMDTVDELNTLLRMCTYNAAKALGLRNYGLERGCAADLVVLDASSPSAAVIGQAEKIWVFKAGRLVAANNVVNEVFN